MALNAAHERLVRILILELSKLGICRVWSQPTGAAYRDGVLIRYGVIGSADISGILKGGKRIEIEVKTGKAVQSERQKAFESMIKSMGGIYIVARDVNEVIKTIKSIAAE